MSLKRIKNKINNLESDMNLKDESLYEFLMNKDNNNALYNLLSDKYLESELGELPGGRLYFGLSDELKERIKDYYNAFENESKTVKANDIIPKMFKMPVEIPEPTVDKNLKWLDYFTFTEVMECGFASNLPKDHINECIQREKQKYIESLKENGVTIPRNLW